MIMLTRCSEIIFNPMRYTSYINENKKQITKSFTCLNKATFLRQILAPRTEYPGELMTIQH